MIQPSPSGTPRAPSVSLGWKKPSTLVSELPTPSARAASMAFHTAGKIELPVGSCWMNPKRYSGTSSK
jgi:hypothetical protein